MLFTGKNAAKAPEMMGSKQFSYVWFSPGSFHGRCVASFFLLHDLSLISRFFLGNLSLLFPGGSLPGGF